MPGDRLLPWSAVLLLLLLLPRCCESSLGSRGAFVEEKFEGFADPGNARFVPPAKNSVTRIKTDADDVVKKLVAAFLKPWARSGFLAPAPRYEWPAPNGPETITIFLLPDGEVAVRDARPPWNPQQQQQLKRSGFSERRADALVRLTQEVGPRVIAKLAGFKEAFEFTVSLGDCVATRQFAADDQIGQYAMWQRARHDTAYAARGSVSAIEAPILTHVACADSRDVAIPFFYHDKRPAVRTGSFGHGYELDMWDAHAASLTTKKEQQKKGESRRKKSLFYRGGERRSCWVAGTPDVAPDGNRRVCGRSKFWAGEEALKLGSRLDAASSKKNYKPLSAVESYAYVANVEGACGFADRAKHLLWMGAALVQQASFCAEYYVLGLEPWVHYIPMAYRFENLKSALDWADDNPKDVETIVENANDFANQLISKKGVELYFETLLVEMARLTKHNSTTLELERSMNVHAAYKTAQEYLEHRKALYNKTPPPPEKKISPRARKPE